MTLPIPSSGYEFNDETVISMFGHEAAEREDPKKLKAYFIRRVDYESVVSNIPLRLVIGFKGVGKSAILKIAHLEDQEKSIPTIWVRPDDINELYGQLSEETNPLKLITLWKKAIARLVGSRLVENAKFTSTSDMEKALTWAEKTGYKSPDLISQLADRLNPLVKSYFDGSRHEGEGAGEHHILQRIAKNKIIRIYIDDLDRGWEATEADRKRLAALINALGDLTSDINGLQVKVSLRSDVYSLIRGTAEFTDKFESSEVWCSWSNHEILIALVKRLYAHFGKEISDSTLKNLKQAELASLLKPIFASHFENTRHWNKAPTYRVLMSLIRRRPRDMVKICSAVAKSAYENNEKTICGKHFLEVLDDYSSSRMQDIITEFRSEMPTVEDLLYKLGPTTDELKRKKDDRYLYSTQELYEKVKNVMGNVQVIFKHGKPVDFHDVCQFLFKIGFVTATKKLTDGYTERIYFEDKRQLLSRAVGDLGYSWEIHPAYRGALFKKSSSEDSWLTTVTPSAEKV